MCLIKLARVIKQLLSEEEDESRLSKVFKLLGAESEKDSFWTQIQNKSSLPRECNSKYKWRWLCKVNHLAQVKWNLIILAS